MKKYILLPVIILCLLAGAVMAGAEGSDPLVSLSYIREVFAPSLKAEIMSEVSALVGEKSVVTVVYPPAQSADIRLDGGHRLTVSEDCELLLRSGRAVVLCSCASDGLCDITSGGLITSGEALEIGHIYMTSGDGAICIYAISCSDLTVSGDYETN